MSPRRRSIDDASISRLGHQRRAIVDRAVQVFDTGRETPSDAPPDTLRQTTALLAVSLEELKVVEEELVQQNEELLITRDAIESTSRHFRRLFEEAPLPYIVTDVVGIVQHANHAALTLLKRPPGVLEGKPLITLVPLDRRGAFRDALNHLQMVETAADWRVKLLRPTDAPVQVAVEVRLLRGERDGEDLICWILRPVEVPLSAN